MSPTVDLQSSRVSKMSQCETTKLDLLKKPPKTKGQSRSGRNLFKRKRIGEESTTSSAEDAPTQKNRKVRPVNTSGVNKIVSYDQLGTAFKEAKTACQTDLSASISASINNGKSRNPMENQETYVEAAVQSMTRNDVTQLHTDLLIENGKKIDTLLSIVNDMKTRMTALEDAKEERNNGGVFMKPPGYPIKTYQNFLEAEKDVSKEKRNALRKYLVTLGATDLKSFVNIAFKESISDHLVKTKFTLLGTRVKKSLKESKFLETIYQAASKCSFFPGPECLADFYPHVQEAIRIAGQRYTNKNGDPKRQDRSKDKEPEVYSESDEEEELEAENDKNDEAENDEAENDKNDEAENDKNDEAENDKNDEAENDKNDEAENDKNDADVESNYDESINGSDESKNSDEGAGDNLGTSEI